MLSHSLPWITSVIAVVAILLFSDGGTIERETTTFVLHYTGDRSVLQKVFDPHANDLGTYQARELSYFTDYLDAIFYRFLYGTFGVVLFIPLSSFVATLLLALVFFRGIVRTSRVDPLTSALMFGCMASSFVFLSTMTLFYRSGKPLLAVVLLALLFHLRAAHTGTVGCATNPRWLTGTGIIAGGLALVAGLLDRQGVFYVAACAVVLGLHYLWTARLRDVLAAMVVALTLLQLYNLVIAPMLVHALNGYWPDFHYQSFPPEHLWRLPLYSLLAAQVLVENATLLGGGGGATSVVLLVATVCALVVSTRMKRVPDQRRRDPQVQVLVGQNRRIATYAALAFGLQVVMFALMIARHPVVYVALDHRYWYYPLPYATTLLFGSVILVEAILARGSPAALLIIRTALALMVVGNLASLGHYRKMMAQGSWFASISAQSDAAARSLRSGVMDVTLTPEYARFVRYHERFLRLDTDR